MTHTPHELTEEFPENVAEISTLKQNDAHFAKLFDNYHNINRAIHRAESDVEPTSDDHITQMRKERLMLKDQINGYLK
ncbi:MAG: YdcH family protein [Hyphomicrobiales bacterium]|nr:YdcH family protein [Hyphomicrobiales bacterium]